MKTIFNSVLISMSLVYIVDISVSQTGSTTNKAPEFKKTSIVAHK